MNSNVDLRQLAVRRDVLPNGTAPRPAARRRHLLTRYVLPGAILLGFLTVIGWAARGSLLPSRPVTVVPVVTTRAEVQQAGAPLFQAAGWVEPRPTPVLATAQAEGLVEQLLIVEGQEVKAGEPVARLNDADARLTVGSAEADLRLREAELASAHATLTAARTNAAQPVHLEAALADADALLARTRTELANLPFQLRVAEARQRLAKLDLEGKAAAPDAVAVRAVNQARSELDSTTAAVEELQGRKRMLEQEAEALQRKREALRKRLELRTEETRQLGEAEAGVKAAEARLQQAQNLGSMARLRLERMTVRAPQAGRVLALVARPGMRVMGLAPGSLHDSSTVVTLYDPGLLQVRADVPLDQVPRVQPGQPVRIETDAVPGGPLEGEVLFKTSQADIQKNTLQVKVAVKSPPADLKPDMLVRLTFLAVPSPGAKKEMTEQLRLLVPRQLVETGEGGTRVWVADQVAGEARSRPVKVGPAASNDLVEITEGLAEADRIISGGREGLRDGERITVTGEDAAVGITAGGTGPTSKRIKRVGPGDIKGKP